jgi:vacuolar protein sorting-associated protein 13A/C
MLFDELAFGLDDHQYRDAILMIDLFHANLKKRKVNRRQFHASIK